MKKNRTHFRYGAKQEVKEPGRVSSKLRRRMGDPHADIFDAVGAELYSTIIETISSNLEDIFNSFISNLEEQIKEELGRRGLEEAAKYFSDWALEILDDGATVAMPEIKEKLEDLAKKAEGEFNTEDVVEGEEDLATLLDTGEEGGEEEDVTVARVLELKPEQAVKIVGGIKNLKRDYKTLDRAFTHTMRRINKKFARHAINAKVDQAELFDYLSTFLPLTPTKK